MIRWLKRLFRKTIRTDNTLNNVFVNRDIEQPARKNELRGIRLGPGESIRVGVQFDGNELFRTGHAEGKIVSVSEPKQVLCPVCLTYPLSSEAEQATGVCDHCLPGRRI